jgi:hypothetical protein
MSAGAFCFGVVIGFITYRTLVRSESRGVSDLAVVVAAVGGATVTALFDPQETDAFGWYGMGLLAGLAGYAGLYAYTHGKKGYGDVMGDKDAGAAGIAPVGTSDYQPTNQR